MKVYGCPSQCEILLYFYMQLNTQEIWVTDIPLNISKNFN